jgi:hypothetical protein
MFNKEGFYCIKHLLKVGSMSEKSVLILSQKRVTAKELNIYLK